MSAISLVSLVPALVLAAAAGAQAPKPASDGYVYEVRAVAPHIRLIYRPDPVRVPAEGNVTVIEQADGLVVIDAGGAPVGGRRIIDKIRSFSAKPVKVVVFTHWHGDHNLGAPAFRAAYPKVRFVSTEATRTAMISAGAKFYQDYGRKFAGTGQVAARFAADAGKPASERAGWAQVAADAPLIEKAYDEVKGVTPADQTFVDHLTLADRDAPVELLFLGRGNTDGDAVAWMPKQKVVAAGDLVVAPYPYGTDSYPAEWVAVLEQLRAMPFAYLIPGHGAVESDRAYLDALIALIGDVRAQVEPRAKAGASLEEIRKAADFEPEYRRFAGDDGFVRLLFRQFFIEPMIANAYKEAKGEPITQ